MNQFKEEWKDVLGYEGIYEISNIGNIRSYKTKKIKKTQKNKEGYERVEVWKDGKRKVLLVHRLVAEAFIPNDSGKKHVIFKDVNSKDIRVDNIMWATISENNSRKLRERKEGIEFSNKPIPVYCPELDRRFVSRTDTARYLGCTMEHINKVITSKRTVRDNNTGKMVSLVNYIG